MTDARDTLHNADYQRLSESYRQQRLEALRSPENGITEPPDTGGPRLKGINGCAHWHYFENVSPRTCAYCSGSE